MEDQLLIKYAKLLNIKADAAFAQDNDRQDAILAEINLLLAQSEELKKYLMAVEAAAKDKKPIPEEWKELNARLRTFRLEDRYSISTLNNDELFDVMYRLYDEKKKGISNRILDIVSLEKIYQEKTGQDSLMIHDLYKEKEVFDTYDINSKSDKELFDLVVGLRIKKENENEKEKKTELLLDYCAVERIYSKRTGDDIKEVAHKAFEQVWHIMHPSPIKSKQECGVMHPSPIKMETNKSSIKKSFQAFNNYIYFDDEKSNIFTNIGFTSYDKILDYKLNDNTQVISKPSTYQTKTDFGSVIGRSIIGGLLSGGVGAIIGGATASQKTVQTSAAATTVIHNYELIITIDNTIVPNISLNFKEDKRRAEEAASMLAIIINRNKQKTTSQNTSSSTSIADEIMKIADLKAKGLINEEEFAAMKKKILGI